MVYRFRQILYQFGFGRIKKLLHFCTRKEPWSKNLASFRWHFIKR